MSVTLASTSSEGKHSDGEEHGFEDKMVPMVSTGSQIQEVRGSKSQAGGVTGLRVSPFQVSGGMSTLQSRASGLQCATEGIPSGPNKLLRVKQQSSLSLSL